MLLLCSCVLLCAVLITRFSDKIGVPALILFMGLGMIFGLGMPFDDYTLTERICTLALIFIIFYGGFGTKWSAAKPVAAKSVLLSTIGVLVTAGLTGLFCKLVLRIDALESFLIGAVLSSTDAASVFSILRSKNLNLKNGTSSMLEIESGSNDPVAYMLTVIIISMMKGKVSLFSIGSMFILQIALGTFIGIAIAYIGVIIFKKTPLIAEGLESIFIIALALSSYAVADYLGGNGFLSVYLTGIILGNSKIRNKKVLVNFFDGVTLLGQIFIFFLIGLLSFPKEISNIIFISIPIALFLGLIARPIAIFMILKPFRASVNQCLLVSFAGLRGAASIVFAIMAVAGGVPLENDLFHIVFVISLLSVAIQGTFLPLVVKKLNMVDDDSDVLKTFNDYQEKAPITLMRVFVPKEHPWVNKTIGEARLPKGTLAVMIKRDDENIIPKGDTVILENDSVILSIPEYDFKDDIKLSEILITKDHIWCNKRISELELPDDVLIALIKRGEKNIIPQGKNHIRENDIVVMYN